MNDKVYIHEFIHITKQNRARYMHHMTANWSPIAQEQRHQLCYGVWGVVGSTGPWPQTVNMWEEDGFDGLASSFGLEFGNRILQDPALEKWWAAAADLRSGGFDRIVVPHPRTRTIEQLCADGAGGEVYAHELVKVESGSAWRFLDAAMEGAEAAESRTGWNLVGAWATAMQNLDECLLLWSIPSWAKWGAAERDQIRGDDALLSKASGFVRDRQRILLVDAPLSPLRTGRQPSREDRTDWTD
ncbi:hypothetical protein [Actinocorallia aurantiaca]